MMKKITFPLCFFLAFFITNKAWSQANCNNAAPFCTGTAYNFPAATNAGSAPAGPNYGCLGSQPNEVWYYLQIANSGNIDITLTNTSSVDVDFICWGPFASPTAPCLTGLTAATIEDCSYSAAATEYINITGAVTGEYYIVMMTNFSNQPTNFTFSQTGGGGSTNCNILCNISAMNANPGPCVSGPNTYSVSGNISTTAPPSSGTLTISSSCGGTPQVINPPFGTSTNYTVTNIPATGTTCTLTASYSADPTCTFTVAYNAPAPCNACAATANNTGPYCPGATIQLSATGGGTYSWSGPGGYTANTQNPTRGPATTTMSGVYTVTVTVGGVTCTASTTVTVNPAPTPTANNTGPYCPGQTIQLSSTPAAATSYSWSGPGGYTANTQNPTRGPATTTMSGIYTVTVTVGGCTASATTSVTVNPTPNPVAANTGPYCAGATIQLNGNGGGTYNWSGPGAFTSTLQNPTRGPATTAMSGVYTVTVTVAGCTATAVTNVVVNPTPAITATNTGPYCAGTTIQLNGTGGGTYSWTGPAPFSSTLQNPTIVASTTANAGVYSLTVTALGCTATASTTVAVNNSFTPNISSNSPICDGATLNLNCVNGVSWSWTGPGFSSNLQNPTIPNATSANSGTYNITVTDAVGCQGTASLSVTVAPPLTLFVSALDATCGGGCDGQLIATPGGGTPGYTYNWTSGCTTPTCTNVCGGNYSVIVTDALGCTISGSTTVNSPVTLGANITAQTNASCNGVCDGTATANASGGAGAYNYSWNTTPVQTTATATGLCAGTYICTVSESSCTPSGVELVPNGDFSGGNTGFSSSYVYTPPPNTLEGQYWVANYTQIGSWNGGMFSSGDHTTGTGDFMMVNGSGTPGSSVWCQTINVSPNTVYDFGAWVSSLNGSSPAILQFEINGVMMGAPFNAPAAPNVWSQFSTQWNSGAATTATICIINQNTSIGGNDFGLDDISFQSCLQACPNTVSVTITEPAPFSFTLTPADTVCNGNNFTMTASDATATYTWNPGAMTGTSQTLAATTTTTYTVNGLSANGCAYTDSVLITVPPAIVLATGGFPATCSGVCDGQLVVLANPTVGPFATYQYLWSNNGTNPSENNICAGTYNVTVTDLAGCTATASATVTEPTSVTAAASAITPATCNAVCDGSVLITPNGGTPNYSYAWVPPATGNNPTTLCAGNYVCTVTDANGCATTVNVAITEPTPVTANINAVAPICIGQTANLTANGGGGNGGYVYTWSAGTTPATGQNVTASPTVTTTYNVSITDANGCAPAVASVTVTVAPSLSVTASSDVTLCVGVTANMSANATGGNGTYTYTWTGGTTPTTGTNVSATPGTTTTYTVTVTDGCGTPAATDVVVVNVNPLPSLTITANNASGCQPVCADFILNSVPASATNSWTFTNSATATNDSTPTICFADPGLYGASVTVTDINGCINSTTANNIVAVYEIPNAEFTFGPQPTSELNPVIYFTDASTGPVTNWFWAFNDPQDSSSTLQNPSFSFPGPGTFDVMLTVTTANGCSDSVSYPVIIDPDFVIYVPNAFTPNGDFGNDTFFPKAIGVDTDNYQMWIYDRWGNMIFTTDEWTKGWDGKVSGKDEIVQQDVYVWKIKLKTFNGEKKSYVGHVTVVK